MLSNELVCAEAFAECCALHFCISIGETVYQQTIVIQVRACFCCSFCPVAHPLSVAPTVRTKQSNLFAAQLAFDRGEEGINFAFFQILVSLCVAADRDFVIL